VRLATAPVTWGVWERTTGRDDLVPAELLLETFVRLGYTATELIRERRRRLGRCRERV
jgi:hypothetical protein